MTRSGTPRAAAGRAIVVGSGPNGLAAAVTLAARGLAVTVLEQSDTVGGGIRSAELTVPGLVHDECAAFHPLAPGSAFFAEHDLAAHGLRWVTAPLQYAHPLADGRGAAAARSLDETAALLGADGTRWKRVFGGVVHRFDALAADITRPVPHVPSHPVALAAFGTRAVLPATVLARAWRTPQARALFAGVAAHAVQPLTAPLTSAVGLTLGAAAHRHGWPVAEGGSGRIVTALTSLLRTLGGEVVTGTRVSSLAELPPAEVTMLDVAPSAAAAIAGDRLPARVRRAYLRYRHGPGAFKVDLAVRGPVPWSYAPAGRAATVHLGGTFEEVAAAEAAVARGAMPERPYVLVGQQAVADPSRGRGDLQPVYAYAHVPAHYGGDATEAILTEIERYAPGFRDRVVATAVRTTTDLSRHNPNYVGGDIVGGANSARQLVFRPRVTPDPYATGIPGVYLCSAATPPGAGAHGMCGYRAAVRALAATGR